MNVIQPAEIQAALISGEAMRAFARRHELSLDWIYSGKLIGLLCMAKWAQRPGRARRHPAARSRSASVDTVLLGDRGHDRVLGNHFK
jgi:hypothetical protein